MRVANTALDIQRRVVWFLITAAAAFAHPPRNPHHDRSGGHVFDHHGVCPNLGVITHGDRSQNLSPSPNHHAIADRGVALPLAHGTSTQRGGVEHEHVISHLGCFTDHYAHAVVNEEPTAQYRTGMNFHPGEAAGDLGE